MTCGRIMATTAQYLQYASIMKLDGGEGSGVRGHTTEHEGGDHATDDSGRWSESEEAFHKDVVASTQQHLRTAKAELARSFPGSRYPADQVKMYKRLLQEHKTTLKVYQKLHPKTGPALP